MAATNSPDADPVERVLVVTRVFDAPRPLVYAAWTEPDRLTRWWGPRGFTVVFSEVDARVGGAWRVRMRSPEGDEHTSGGVYREITPPERLVFTHAWEGCEDGEPGHETLVTITFAEDAGKTRMTFRQAVFATSSSRDSHEEGWSSAFEVLGEYLAQP